MTSFPGKWTWILIIAICASGISFSAWVAGGTDSRLRDNLLLNARIIADSVDPHDVRALSFTLNDRTNPGFMKLEDWMRKLGKALECRSLYSVVQQGDFLIFGPENLAPNDPDASPPGTVYRNPPEELRSVFRTRKGITVGPSRDEYGTFVSAFSPVIDPVSGTVILVIGLDVEAAEWKWDVFSGAALPMSLTLLLVSLFIFYVYYRKTHVVLHARDVSLCESERRYRHLLESMAQGVVYQGSDGRIIDANPAAQRILGLDLEAMKGRTSSDPGWESIHEDGSPYPGETHPAMLVIQTGTPLFHSIMGVRNQREGTIKWIEIDAVPQFRPGHDRPCRVCTIFEDITDRRHAEETMREKNEFIASLLRAIPVAIFYKDREGRYLGCNRKFTEIMGVTAEEMKGKTAHELWPGELAEKYHAMDLELMRNRQHQVYEYQVKAKDGLLRPVIYAKDVFLNKDGEVAGLVGAFLDITDRKRTEERLTRQITLFRNLFESSPEAIAVLDHEDRVLEVNRSFETIFGYSEAEAKGRKINDLVAPGPYLADASSVSRTVIGEGRIVEKEAVRCRKDGSPIHVSLIGYPIVENDRQTGAFAIYRDITESRQAQEALRESGIRYQMLFESAHDAIFMMHEERFIQCNQSALLMFGCRKGDIIGQTPMRFSPPLQPDGGLSNEQAVEKIRLALSGTSDPFEWRHMRLDGTEFDAEVILNRVDLAGGPYLLATVRDVSDRKRSEEEKRRLEAQLVQARKMESIGRLAGGVAHDFNNMLSAILGHAELAMDKCRPSEPIYHDITVIEKAARRSAALTQQLLAFARKQTMTPKILDLNDVVAGMLKMLQRLIGEDIDFAWMPGAGLWPIKMDPSQIDQVLANLCVNARDAIDGIGKITIETENVVLDEAYCRIHTEFTCGEFVMLAVSDNGRGMDTETLDQIFEPFFTTKERGKGTGLGLATVYGIVKQNDGFINVYSEPGQGTTFKLYLPRFQGDAAKPVNEKGAEIVSGRGETVLLVEDEDIILNLGTVMLEKLGYHVLAAGTPSEALQMAQTHADEIRLLITDVVMPEMSGRDLANLISSIKPGLKCLYLSGYTANVIVHRGVLDEGVQFLQKPFSLLDLSVKVRGILEQNQEEEHW